ncbi:MAG: DUF547 domain-containing protein [Candidatus Handelsmanbacteria bacterium]|nr:DUF547 domain-containing protein [Candidatus Handelsmanbacteria bacterium]
MGGKQFSLEQVEHRIIRPQYRDPRVHFALNCAALGCPVLLRGAYQGEALDSLLAAQTRRFAADPRQVRLVPVAGVLHLSRILEWYWEHLTRWFSTPSTAAPALVDYLPRYLPQDQTAPLRRHPEVKLVFEECDWSLNQQALNRKKDCGPFPRPPWSPARVPDRARPDH